MFSRSKPVDRPVTFFFLDRAITAAEGDTIAAALLAAGILQFRRSPEDGGWRGPHCMIGNCFECMVEIEGIGGRQACRARVAPDLRVRPHEGRATTGGGDGA